MRDLKPVVWLGDSKEVLERFPRLIKAEIGFQLYLLQKGEEPPRSRPMKSIGIGVYELKDQDPAGWYRTIYVLHVFKKQSAKTSKNDLEIAKMRLKKLGARK